MFPLLEHYVADVFTKCLEQSIFPEPLKIASNSVVLKSNPAKYRPINLLGSLSKVVENLK